MSKEQALKMAKLLSEQFIIGIVSVFCDEPGDFDTTDIEELAEAIFEAAKQIGIAS